MSSPALGVWFARTSVCWGTDEGWSKAEGGCPWQCWGIFALAALPLKRAEPSCLPFHTPTSHGSI